MDTVALFTKALFVQDTTLSVFLEKQSVAKLSGEVISKIESKYFFVVVAV